MKSVLFFASVLALSLAISDFEQWKEFKLIFGKVYDRSLAEQHRYKIFLQNLRKIEAHNAKFDAGEVSWTMAINQFADLTGSEFESLYLSSLNETDMLNAFSSSKIFTGETAEDVPDAIDWREKGGVGPVKNQGECGSCWTFSSLGSVEGIYFAKSGELLDLSEQNILDCVGEDYYCHGCDGGRQVFVFEYIHNVGVMYDKDYPYTGAVGTCKYDDSKKATGLSVDSFALVDGNEVAIKKAVGTVGPVSISIHYDAELHQFYSSGIFDSPNCADSVNHGVVIVGYGTENGTDYWICKNSYGDTWGEKGYFRMVRGKNMCNVNRYPCYPTLN